MSTRRKSDAHELQSLNEKFAELMELVSSNVSGEVTTNINPQEVTDQLMAMLKQARTEMHDTDIDADLEAEEREANDLRAEVEELKRDIDEHNDLLTERDTITRDLAQLQEAAEGAQKKIQHVTKYAAELDEEEAAQRKALKKSEKQVAKLSKEVADVSDDIQERGAEIFHQVHLSSLRIRFMISRMHSKAATLVRQASVAAGDPDAPNELEEAKEAHAAVLRSLKELINRKHELFEVMSDLVRKEGEFFNAERELALDIMEREEELLGTAEVIFSGSTTAHRSEQLSLLEQQIRRYEVTLDSVRGKLSSSDALVHVPATAAVSESAPAAAATPSKKRMRDSLFEEENTNFNELSVRCLVEDTGMFTQLVNHETEAIDLSGWKLVIDADGEIDQMDFPEDFIIEVGNVVVIVRGPADAYDAVPDTVADILVHWDSSILVNRGTLYLLDSDGKRVSQRAVAPRHGEERRSSCIVM